MTLSNKYAGVVAAAQSAGINNLQVVEQDGILYVSGTTAYNKSKDAVWDALGLIDPNFSASDINVDVQVAGLALGTSLVIDTESSNLNIRREASTEGAIVGKAAKGEVVTLVEQSSDEWWKIRTKDGEEGYAYARYLRA